MTEAAPICRSYDDLIDRIGARVGELGLSRQTIDDMIGWAPGYAGKVLGPTPSKRLGAQSLFEMLQLIGLGIAVVPDPEARPRDYPRRNELRVRANVRMDRLPWLINSKNAAQMATKANAKRTPQQRTRMAKKAARARWRKPRMVEIKGSACHAEGTSSAKAPQ